MEIEYTIACEGVTQEKLMAALRGLPSPIARPQMREIYNFRVERDGYYFVDRGVRPATASVALRHLVDSALASGAHQVTITRL